MSALGADPDGETAYIRAKGRAETVVRESDLDWTIVRPSVIFGDGGEFVGFTMKSDDART
ncbi:MAG: NAD(P)H-binding protein [Halodesulfurarchaeum sp.]|nr:NAD(P)H-binding protein [Halodesulfurarchaeum sp.]